MTNPAPSPQNEIQARRLRRTALACAAFALTMMGVAFAAVPLYDLFCRMTGFGGTPIVGTAPANQVLDQTISVRFDANVAPGLDWQFTPEANEIDVRIGETKTVFYRVRNAGATASTGIASFNVQPPLAGAYFVKLQCFCFTEQTLQPGETLESAVVFYVDPQIVNDPNTRDTPTITLSYTYFPAKTKTPVAAAQAATKRN